MTFEQWAISYFGAPVEFPDTFRAAFEAGQRSILDRLAKNPDAGLTDIHILEAALFAKAPRIGSKDCSHEVNYQGYHRVLLPTEIRHKLTDINFPPSQQDEPVMITHVAGIDENGVIVTVKEIIPNLISSRFA